MKKIITIIAMTAGTAMANPVDVEKIVNLVEIAGMNGYLCAAVQKMDKNTCDRYEKASAEIKAILDKNRKAGTMAELERGLDDREKKDRMFAHRLKRVEKARIDLERLK